jgi:hypothetical protein
MGFADLIALLEFHAHNPDAPNKPVAVMMVYNDTPASTTALEKSGIKTPVDLSGKKLGAPVFDAGRRAIPSFAKANAVEDVTWTAMDPPLRETMPSTSTPFPGSSVFQMSGWLKTATGWPRNCLRSKPLTGRSARANSSPLWVRHRSGHAGAGMGRRAVGAGCRTLGFADQGGAASRHALLLRLAQGGDHTGVCRLHGDGDARAVFCHRETHQSQGTSRLARALISFSSHPCRCCIALSCVSTACGLAPGTNDLETK